MTRKVSALTVILYTTLCGCGDNMATPVKNETLFDHFSPLDLGVVKVVNPNATLGTKGEFVKFLRVDGPDKLAGPVIVSIRAEFSITQPTVSTTPGVGPAAIVTGVTQLGGPLVGRIRWGVGGGYNMMDFDIPSPVHPGLLFPTNLPANQPVDDIGNGMMFNLSGAAFELLIRNDGNLSFTVNPGATDRIGNPFPAKVFANISEGTVAPTGSLRRSIYVAGSGLGANSLAAGGNTAINIPAFARRVRFFRNPWATTPLTIVTQNNVGNTLRVQDIPINSDGPMELTPNEVTMTIFNTGAVAITHLVAVFDLII